LRRADGLAAARLEKAGARSSSGEPDQAPEKSEWDWEGERESFRVWDLRGWRV